MATTTLANVAPTPEEMRDFGGGSSTLPSYGTLSRISKIVSAAPGAAESTH